MKYLVKRARRMVFSKPLPGLVDEEIASRVHNVSETGCMLNAKSWVKVNDSLHEIHILPPQTKAFRIRGQIVRAKMVPQGDSGIYELGIRFDKSDPSYDEFLRWFQELPGVLLEKVTFKS